MRVFRKLACHCVVLSIFLPIHSVVSLSVRNKKPPALPSQRNEYRKKKSILFVSSTTPYREINENKQETLSSPPPSLGSATISQEVFNLLKTIIGAGVLSLPVGIAQMASKCPASNSISNSGVVVSVACLLIAVTGGISAYTYSLIARVCKITNSDTYADCWKATRAPSLAWTIALISTLNCFAINLSYSMVLADTFRQLLSSFFALGGKSHPAFFAGLASYNSRSVILLFLTATTLIPLSCIKNLSSLAHFSLFGLLGTLYTAFVIALRCFDGSYTSPNGRFLADLELAPSFPSAGSGEGVSLLQPLQNPKTLTLVSMLSTAYIAHFNAPKFYRDLKDSDSQPKRFHLGVVAPSFGISAIFYFLVSSLGYMTFGSSTQGMILSNYSTNDVLASLSRLALGLSLITSYPLLFMGLRNGIVDLLNQVSPFLNRNGIEPTIENPQHQEEEQQQQQDQHKKRQLVLSDRQSDRLTVVLVSLISFLALKITDITFVASLSGALTGTSLIFIFPPLMFRSALAMESKRVNKPFTPLQRFERRFCSAIIGLGVFIAGLGAKMAWTR